MSDMNRDIGIMRALAAEREREEAARQRRRELYGEPTYKIVRKCFNERAADHNLVIRTGLTLEEAQEHCQRDDTQGDGWFDAYYEEI